LISIEAVVGLRILNWMFPVETMVPWMAVLTGLGLSATAGLRVFVPLFAASVAIHLGWIEVNEEFRWMGSPAAVLLFGTAMVAEVGAYYIPWVDNLLDTVTGPLAIVAGTVLAGVAMPDLPLMLDWLLALMLGGGGAGAVQLSTTVLRGASTATTGGVGNPVVSTGETTAAVAGVSLILLLPVVGAILVLGFLSWAVFRFWKRGDRRSLETGASDRSIQ